MAQTIPRSDHYQVPATAIYPFLFIAFGLAWGLVALMILFNDAITRMFGELSASHPLFILAVYAPAIAAFLVVLVSSGFAGLARFVSRFFLWRASLGWYAIIVAVIPAVYIVGAFLKGTLFTDPFPFSSVNATLSAIGFMLILGPMEEFGWRGVALPLLQRHMTPLAAGLVLGAIWGVWHLPAFFLGGTPQSAWGIMPFMIGAIAVSVILTPLFNASKGSLLLAALFHFQLNNPLWPDAQPYDTALFVAVAVLVVGANRATMLSVNTAVREVVPPA